MSSILHFFCYRLHSKSVHTFIHIYIFFSLAFLTNTAKHDYSRFESVSLPNQITDTENEMSI